MGDTYVVSQAEPRLLVVVALAAGTFDIATNDVAPFDVSGILSASTANGSLVRDLHTLRALHDLHS